MNKAELSRILGFSLPTVNDWIRRGCPVHQRPNGKTRTWQLRVADVVSWLLDQAATPAGAADLTAERTRLTRLQADRQQHALELERRQVVPIEDVSQLWSHLVTDTKSQLLAIPTRCAPELVGLASPDAAQAVVAEHLREVLADLSGNGLPHPADTTEPEPAAV